MTLSRIGRSVKAKVLLKLNVKTEFNNSSIIHFIISIDVLFGTSMGELTQQQLWESTHQQEDNFIFKTFCSLLAFSETFKRPTSF